MKKHKEYKKVQMNSKIVLPPHAPARTNEFPTGGRGYNCSIYSYMCHFLTFHNCFSTCCIICSISLNFFQVYIRNAQKMLKQCFVSVSTGQSWHIVVKPLARHSPYLVMCFISFIALTLFGVLNAVSSPETRGNTKKTRSFS